MPLNFCFFLLEFWGSVPLNIVSSMFILVVIMALDKMPFTAKINIDIFLISAQKYMLWVLIRSASLELRELLHQKYLLTCAKPRFRSVWSESSLGTFWITNDAKKTLIRLSRCTGWFKSSMDAHIRRYDFLGSNSCCQGVKMHPKGHISLNNK